MKSICCWKNNRFSSFIYPAILFFMIHIFVIPLNAMRTVGHQPYKKTYQQAKTILHKIENAQKKRNVLIFLDDSEKDKLGSISGDLVPALYQEASPIIVSSSLVSTLLEWREKSKESIEVLLNELANTDWLAERYGPNWQEIIQIKERIAVCIDSEKVKEYNARVNTVSDIEIELGFKVNHMKTIEYTALHRSSLKEYFSPHYFAGYFIDSLEAIFCTAFDYHTSKREGFDRWPWRP